MIRVEYTAAAPDDGKALRAVLRGSMGLSASLVKAVKWLPDGILIDGVPARLDAVVRFGQRISVSASAGAPARLHAGPVPPMPPVLYEDGCLLIIDKPAGMTVHPSAGHSDGTLADAAADYLRRQDPFAVFCPVSRLDRYTSGVLCAAKNRFAAQRLSAQLQNGGMSRVYRAVLCGALPSEEGVVDAPIAHGSGVRREVSPGGRPAVTHWRVLGRGPSHTLAELWLETGRTHQIRVHMAHLGCPVAGDFLYGAEDVSRPGFALHAQYLTLAHPLTGEPVCVCAPAPAWFDDLLAR